MQLNMTVRHRIRKLNWLAALSMSTVRQTAAFGSSMVSNANAVASPVLETKTVPGLKNGMDYCSLGSATDCLVSKVCMGTMTFGKQNTIEEGVKQLQTAFDEYGVNFLDTAEMYPVPGSLETKGLTDATVAKFLKDRRRSDVVLATKVSGRSERIDWLRAGGESTQVNRAQIFESVDASLKRLGTDYIDLLQIHWPGTYISSARNQRSFHTCLFLFTLFDFRFADRYVGGLFGQPDFSPSKVWDTNPLEEQLEALKEVVDSGKVRYVGVSNETPYGVMEMLHLSRSNPSKYAHIVSIQNSYSLTVRKDFEAGLSEVCYHNKIGLLPYSPLAGGVLTGKYENPKTVPENARLKLFPGFMERYLGSQNQAAVREYCEIARRNSMSPAQLALSWVYHREHVCSTIIGSTTQEQLHECLGAYDIRLEDDVLDQINKTYKKYTDPTKAY